ELQRTRVRIRLDAQSPRDDGRVRVAGQDLTEDADRHALQGYPQESRLAAAWDVDVHVDIGRLVYIPAYPLLSDRRRNDGSAFELIERREVKAASQQVRVVDRGADVPAVDLSEFDLESATRPEAGVLINDTWGYGVRISESDRPRKVATVQLCEEHPVRDELRLDSDLIGR